MLHTVNLPAIAYLRSFSDLSADDLDASDEQFSALEHACNHNEPIIVLAEEADGYFDIKLQDGTVFDALSWVHITGFTAGTTAE